MRNKLIRWCLYDSGISAFNTIVTTFVFAVYYAKVVAPTPEIGASLWGTTMALAGGAILLLSPIFAQKCATAPRWWLRALTAIVVGGTALLFIPTSNLYLPLIIVGFTTVAFELSFVVYSAYLPILAGNNVNRWSGYGWAFGYVGGIAALAITLFVFIKSGLFASDAHLDIRAAMLFVAAWVALLCWPALRLPAPALADMGQHFTWRALGDAWRACRAQPGLLRFCITSALFRDGINTITAFGGIYAGTVHGMAFDEVVMFAIALNILAALGAAGFAATRALHSLMIIRISLIGLIISGAGVLLAPDKTWFWVTALGLGVFFGPAQAAGRAYILELAGEKLATPALALYTMTGRTAGFVGPALYSAAIAATGAQQGGMATVLLLFALSLVAQRTLRNRPTEARTG